jgi:hypothetical protein
MVGQSSFARAPQLDRSDGEHSVSGAIAPVNYHRIGAIGYLARRLLGIK